MNFGLDTLLTDNGKRYVEFLILTVEILPLDAIEWIDLNFSLIYKVQDLISSSTNQREEKKYLLKGEIIARYSRFGTELEKSYILVDYWLENKERKFPIIRGINIPREHFIDIDKKQLAALLTIDDYPSRIKYRIDDYLILEQYLDLKEGIEITIRDPNNNKECTGKISESKLVNFKFFHFLQYGSKEIRFGIDSLIQVSYEKAPSATQQEYLAKQQSQMLNKCQTSKKNAAGTLQPEQPIHNNKLIKSIPPHPLHPTADAYNNKYSQTAAIHQPELPNTFPKTAPLGVGHDNKDMHFPRNEPKHHNYEQDKNAATQGSDAVPLNDSDPVRFNSHGVVKDCIVKVKLKEKNYTGRVVWIGEFKAVPGHVWVLIETENKREDLNEPTSIEEANGYKYKVKIGNVKDGHGLFVPAERCKVLVPEDVQCNKLPQSSLIGSPNEYDPMTATIISGEFIPPIKDVRKILGLKKGIQGLDNSCYMDASLFGMFCFNERLDDIFLKTSQEADRNNSSVERYTVVQKILKERIVYPLRKEGFVRADQILLLRHKLDEAGVVDGLLDREKDPEEFLTCLLQHVLNVQPYLKIRGTRNEDGFFFQIFTTRRPHINLPTVQLLLEHAFREDKLMLAEVPQFFLIQMPRDGKHFRLYPHIVPSLTLDISNITQSVYSPKCVLCSRLAEFRCEECEKSELYDARKVYIHYCKTCSDLHTEQTKHTPAQLTIKPKQQQDGAQMKLFAVLTIEIAHYVCFAKCGANPRDWVMFDSMHDRIEEGLSGRNVPNVVHLPDLEDWLADPDKLCKVSDRDAKKTVPDYIRRLTQDVSVCMYYSAVNEMF